MNAFEYIDEVRNVIRNSTDGEEPILKKDAYQMMLNLLDMMAVQLENAEYNYQVESVSGDIVTIDKFTIFQKKLNDQVIIFQPIPIGEYEMEETDYESLRQVLEELHRSGQIKENILILPPDIRLFRAILEK